MKQTILKKLLVSGAAAVGIMGLSTPAAFAWSSDSGYGGYNNYHPSYKHSSYHMKSYSPCHRESNYGSNMYPSYGDWYGKNRDSNRMNNVSSTTSVNVAFQFAFSSTSSFNSSSSSNNYRW